VPYYLFMRQFKLDTSLTALVLIYFIFTLPFTVWTLRGFINGIPEDLEQAAMVDGCSRWMAFWRVTFPLLGPGLVATSVYAFITAWNEYLYAFVFLQDNSRYTLPVWLATFQTAFGTDWGGSMAASAMFTIPVLVFFLIVQRNLVAGITAGAVKG
jgi:N,N'-diacetylchitobiose transport system permease protein